MRTCPNRMDFIASCYRYQCNRSELASKFPSWTPEWITAFIDPMPVPEWRITDTNVPYQYFLWRWDPEIIVRSNIPTGGIPGSIGSWQYYTIRNRELVMCESRTDLRPRIMFPKGWPTNPLYTVVVDSRGRWEERYFPRCRVR